MINTVKGMVQPLRAGRKVIMTTLNKLANINVTINFELPVECLTLDDFVAMSDDALRAIQNRVASKMNAATRIPNATNAPFTILFILFSFLFKFVKSLKDFLCRQPTLNGIICISDKLFAHDF